MVLKGPLLDRACGSGSATAKRKPGTKSGWDERSSRTTRQPGLRRRPEFSVRLIHDLRFPRPWMICLGRLIRQRSGHRAMAAMLIHCNVIANHSDLCNVVGHD